MDTQQIVDGYGAAWGETDVAKRAHLLEQAWADDGTYTDPQSHVEGREALSELIGSFQAQVGAKIVATSAVDKHHDTFRFTWAMQSADGGTMMMEGIDFGELAPDGRIKRIVGFFGPPPAAP